MLQKDDRDWVNRSMLYEVDGVRGRGSARMMWNQVVENMRECWANKIIEH